jgi:hypothetical protein
MAAIINGMRTIIGMQIIGMGFFETQGMQEKDRTYFSRVQTSMEPGVENTPNGYSMLP